MRQPRFRNRSRSGSSEFMCIASSNFAFGTRFGRSRYRSNAYFFERSGKSPSTSTAPLQYHWPIVVNFNGRGGGCGRYNLVSTKGKNVFQFKKTFGSRQSALFTLRPIDQNS